MACVRKSITSRPCDRQLATTVKHPLDEPAAPLAVGPVARLPPADRVAYRPLGRIVRRLHARRRRERPEARLDRQQLADRRRPSWRRRTATRPPGGGGPPRAARAGSPDGTIARLRVPSRTCGHCSARMSACISNSSPIAEPRSSAVDHRLEIAAEMGPADLTLRARVQVGVDRDTDRSSARRDSARPGRRTPPDRDACRIRKTVTDFVTATQSQAFSPPLLPAGLVDVGIEPPRVIRAPRRGSIAGRGRSWPRAC